MSQLPEVSGNPQFFRIAVAEHGGKYGVIVVDDRNGVRTLGSQDFSSQAAAIQALCKNLGAVIEGRNPGPSTWG